jgi:hypothetical protein
MKKKNGFYDGFYWVQLAKGRWVVAECNSGVFWLQGGNHQASEFKAVYEVPIELPPVAVTKKKNEDINNS